MSHTPGNQWTYSVEAAFADAQLCQRIFAAAALDPLHLPRLFEDIAQHVLSLTGATANTDASGNGKKRKLDDTADGVGNNHVVTSHIPPPQSLKPYFECKEVSVQAPARKKLKIELAGDGTNPQNEQFRLVNPATTEIEYGLRAADVDQAFFLPMPEKQARQTNCILLPKPGALDIHGRPAEQVLFVLNETLPTPAASMHGNGVAEDDTYVAATERALAKWLRPFGKKIVKPDAGEFASSIVQSHRKGEKAFHVKAHRGSKEGYLFFLENGIIFGFKKPLVFFPFAAIDSISYTSVLQRTFNLVIAAVEGSNEPVGAEVKEVECSMLDQEDFAGIDAYIKKHGLNDASMAAQRRAKAYNVNKEKKGDGDANGGVADAEGEEELVDGQTELQRAEQQLQDEEDELEEDYEVSGGESEGEGEDSEEEEEYEDGDVEEVEGGEEEEEVDGHE